MHNAHTRISGEPFSLVSFHFSFILYKTLVGITATLNFKKEKVGVHLLFTHMRSVYMYRWLPPIFFL